jgi:hypothetical protein
MNNLNLQKLPSQDIDKLILLPNVIEFTINTNKVEIVFENKKKIKDKNGIEKEIDEFKYLTFSYQKDKDIWILTKYRIN